MKQKFSSQLKEQVIAYFLRRHQVDLSQEQAEQYLISMADLYLVLSQKKGTEQAF